MRAQSLRAELVVVAVEDNRGYTVYSSRQDQCVVTGSLMRLYARARTLAHGMQRYFVDCRLLNYLSISKGEMQGGRNALNVLVSEFNQ